MKYLTLKSPRGSYVYHEGKRTWQRVATARLTFNGSVEATGATIKEALEKLREQLLAELKVD